MFDLAIMVDWSAATKVSKRPRADRCWLAWGSRQKRPQPEYQPTRLSCEHRILELVAQHDGRVLVGLDFPFGYCHQSGLPSGRDLCSTLGSLVRDHPDGASNRFDVAAELNRRLVANGVEPPPFWGHPATQSYPNLTPTKPTTPLSEYRLVEKRLREQRHSIQSAFKLFGRGSVGSQTITGLASVHRMLNAPHAQNRGILWPFETCWSDHIPPDAVVFAEIWPTLGDFHSPRYHDLAIKDARQVAAMTDWALDNPCELSAALSRPLHLDRAEEEHARTTEGWILGAPVGTGP